MGGLGSDAAIETADVVIQTDQPSRVATAIHAGRQTRRIVWQNISLAFGVKLLVLILGAGGIATLLGSCLCRRRRRPHCDSERRTHTETY